MCGREDGVQTQIHTEKPATSSLPDQRSGCLPKIKSTLSSVAVTSFRGPEPYKTAGAISEGALDPAPSLLLTGETVSASPDPHKTRPKSNFRVLSWKLCPYKTEGGEVSPEESQSKWQSVDLPFALFWCVYLCKSKTREPHLCILLPTKVTPLFFQLKPEVNTLIDKPFALRGWI